MHRQNFANENNFFFVLVRTELAVYLFPVFTKVKLTSCWL